MPGRKSVVNFDGGKARAIRERNEWSRPEVAEAVPCSAVHLGKLERGECKPTAELFADLARALRVKPAALLAGNEPDIRASWTAARPTRIHSRPGESKADFIARLVESAPPLTDAQRSKLAALLAPAAPDMRRAG